MQKQELYLQAAGTQKHIKKRLFYVAFCLSLVAVLCVFWWLKMTGITMAGEAFCGMDEHQHTAACQTLICEQAERPAHTHTDACYGCTPEEAPEHSHTDACYGCEPAEPTEETPEHSHEDTCLVCTPEPPQEHIHTEACLTCGQEETEGHTHAEACYETSCGKKEHVHVPSCYSDISADLETEADWEKSLGTINRECSTADQVVQVATSQLGVTESERNFEVDAHGVRRGITRYGQWYGNPYGDWSAMFASFCLHYAGAEDLPANAGPESMRLEWEKAGLYKSSSEQTPKVGHLMFLNMESPENNIEPRATFVAVITKVENGFVTAIAGDVDGRVEEIAFEVDVPRIIGYGVVPDSSGYVPEITPPDKAPGQTRYIWLDGTCGGLMSLGGSDNTRYNAAEGSTLTLPTSWKSPDKYHYVLRGWYNISTHTYYEPGAAMPVTNNAVLYADWQAATYDVGQFNNKVDTETVSTNHFITTRVFDYGVLFNILSERVDITVNNNSHSEVWNLLTSGNNPYNGDKTLNFIFRDWDRGDEDISYPKGHNAINNPTDKGKVYTGLYTDTLRELLFNPETEVLGKNYLGQGDYLFQLCEDPNHDHYGYYYYNSERNAASYNQSEQRFYVYDYLECTRSSSNASDEGKYSDFLPLNSPYANTNGKTVNTYSYGGVEGEYNGTTHYMFDCRYNDSDNQTKFVGTNFMFGMSVDVQFFLPNTPGTTAAGGGYGNQDVYGKDMHFRFTGDDDVWIFVDGKMVLDLGGLHGRETGDINFSTGTVMVNGVVDQKMSNTLKSFAAGEHVLTLYYLERGSSMSNCSIYFNLAPRFDFSIQKEDVLTQNVLNGAQFSVFMDRDCTIPAELWTSKKAHDEKQPSTNVFTVVNGAAHMWGMGAGNTYYIRETKPPDDPNYGYPNGIICLTFDKTGTASYNVEILDTGQGVSPGFIVHGFRIDRETQKAYIVATNAPHWVQETTTVQALKHWADNQSHAGEAVTVYLTVTDPDGTVRRLQEAQLSADNEWKVSWENLPKYLEDGVTLVQYGVEESYVSGYYSVVEQKTGQFEIVRTEWKSATAFENGKEYIIKNSDGKALSTQQSAEDTGFKWVTEDEAKNSSLALWTASVKNSTVRLTNRAGQTITFWYGNGSPTDFFALNQQLEDNNRKQYFTVTKDGQNLLLGYSNNFINKNMLSNGKFDRTTDRKQALRLTLLTQTGSTTQVPIEGIGFLVTNTPLEKETSLTVHKDWWIPADMNVSVYEKEQVTVKLYANGVDTGRTVTLTLKNGWQDTFRGLPYESADGVPIVYTVKEVRTSDRWVISYGDVVPTGGSPPNYSVTVTNTYRVGGPLLPTTGSPARLLYTVCGIVLMLIPLVVGFGLRRKRERRRE